MVQIENSIVNLEVHDIAMTSLLHGKHRVSHTNYVLCVCMTMLHCLRFGHTPITLITAVIGSVLPVALSSSSDSSFLFHYRHLNISYSAVKSCQWILKMHICFHFVAVLLFNKVSTSKLTKHTAFPVTSPCYSKSQLVLHRLNVKLQQQEMMSVVKGKLSSLRQPWYCCLTIWCCFCEMTRWPVLACPRVLLLSPAAHSDWTPHSTWDTVKETSSY